MILKFQFRRVAVLMGIVLLLAVMFSMARRSNVTILTSFENPSRSAAQQATYIADPKPSWPDEGFLVVEDPLDPVSVGLRDSVELALDCFSQRPKYVDMPTRADLYGASQAVIITASYLNRIGEMKDFFDYARDGGTLVFAIRPEVNHTFMGIYQQLGINEHGFFMWSEGFHLREGYLGAGPYDVEENFLQNSSIQLRVLSECDVIATDNAGVPQIWTRKYGKGNLLVMNNSLMNYKATGGLLAALLAEMNGPVLYPVINARAFALEAFPLPSDVNRAALSAIYMRDGEGFLRDVWWPDMLRFSVLYSIPFTAGIMSGYAGEDPYASPEKASEELRLIFYAKELARYGGELAMTGFNQKPLYFTKLTEQMQFEPWSSAGLAGTRLTEAIAMLKVLLPDYAFYAYLPPSRILDEEGRRLAVEAMPDLQVICGDFYNRDFWYQDFGIDEDGIVRLPVVTSGFSGTHEQIWNMLCVAAAKGIVFHSCNISELLLETDPKKDWRTVSQHFFKFAEVGFGATGYLDSMTVTNAANRLREMMALNPQITYREGGLDVSCTLTGKAGYFFLLTPGLTPVAIGDVDLLKIFDGKYLVTTRTEHFSIGWMPT